MRPVRYIEGIFIYISCLEFLFMHMIMQWQLTKGLLAILDEIWGCVALHSRPNHLALKLDTERCARG